jgi:hypothetical protein
MSTVSRATQSRPIAGPGRRLALRAVGAATVVAVVAAAGPVAAALVAGAVAVAWGVVRWRAIEDRLLPPESPPRQPAWSPSEARFGDPAVHDVIARGGASRPVIGLAPEGRPGTVAIWALDPTAGGRARLVVVAEVDAPAGWRRDGGAW